MGVTPYAKVLLTNTGRRRIFQLETSESNVPANEAGDWLERRPLDNPPYIEQGRRSLSLFTSNSGSRTAGNIENSA